MISMQYHADDAWRRRRHFDGLPDATRKPARPDTKALISLGQVKVETGREAGEALAEPAC